MIALAVALVAVVAGQLAANVWLVYGRVTDSRALADERVAHTATNGKLERAGFEFDATKAALAEQKRINGGLEDVLAGYINSAPNSDLARGDVLARVLRAARKQADRDGPVSAGAVEAVPPLGTTASTDAAIMRPDD